MDTYTLGVQRPLNKWSFGKDHYFREIYNKQFQGTIFLMVFDFQGIYIYLYYGAGDHPLMYGNEASLDPGTCVSFIFFGRDRSFLCSRT